MKNIYISKNENSNNLLEKNIMICIKAEGYGIPQEHISRVT